MSSSIFKYFHIGYFAKTHGLKGNFLIKPLSYFENDKDFIKFLTGKEIILEKKNRKLTFLVQKAALFKNKILITPSNPIDINYLSLLKSAPIFTDISSFKSEKLEILQFLDWKIKSNIFEEAKISYIHFEKKLWFWELEDENRTYTICFDKSLIKSIDKNNKILYLNLPEKIDEL